MNVASTRCEIDTSSIRDRECFHQAQTIDLLGIHLYETREDYLDKPKRIEVTKVIKAFIASKEVQVDGVTVRWIPISKKTPLTFYALDVPDRRKLRMLSISIVFEAIEHGVRTTGLATTDFSYSYSLSTLSR